MVEKMQDVEATVLVTGATGFLGRYAVREFADQGYNVIATGRNMTALTALMNDTVTTYRADITELSDLELPVDTVVHLAALSSPWGKWDDFYESNVAGTKRIIDFSECKGVRRVVYVSSPSIYSGLVDRLDIGEDDYDPNNRLNHYIHSKILAEATLKHALADGRLQELVIIRPRGLIGVGDTSMIPRLMDANRRIGIPLFNDGTNMVDLTCVENVAYALRLAAEARHANGQAYNITNGEPRQFKEILNEFFNAIGERPHYRKMNFKAAYSLAAMLEKVCERIPSMPEPLMTRYTVATLAFSQTLNISKAVTELGYKPRISLEEGIERYAQP